VVVGIYRPFGRASRLAASRLRELLAPTACQTLTPLSSRWPARLGVDDETTPDAQHVGDLSLVVDVSRTPQPAARAIADAAGVSLIARTPPPMRPQPDGSALARGTAIGRAVALGRPLSTLPPADQAR
jgi:hypothetical protein